MKLTTFKFSIVPEDIEDKKLFNYLEELQRDLEDYFNEIVSVINGQVNFGGGVKPTDSSKRLSENIDGQWIAFTTDTTANQAVSHDLKRIPKKFFVGKKAGNVILWDGSSAHTTTTLYVASNARVDVEIFVI